MQILETIRNRRSIGKTTGESPTREQIELLLEAATWAPNHHVTHPWKFVVIAGDERTEFGRVTAQSKLQRMVSEGRSIDGEEERLIAKAHRAPVIIAIGIEPKATAHPLEEIQAGAAAAQNMLLIAHELGLASIWRSGDAAYDPNVAHWLGFAEGATIIGFIYVGYPAVSKERPAHLSFDQVTEWRGWPDDSSPSTNHVG